MPRYFFAAMYLFSHSGIFPKALVVLLRTAVASALLCNLKPLGSGMDDTDQVSVSTCTDSVRIC